MALRKLHRNGRVHPGTLRRCGYLLILLAIGIGAACVAVPLNTRADFRRAAYLESHGELPSIIADAISKGHVVIGMDIEQVRAALGKPVSTVSIGNVVRPAQVLIYPSARLHQGPIHTDGGTMYRVVLINGRVAVVESF